MNQTTDQLIKELDTELIYKLFKTIGESDCSNRNCSKCLLAKKLKTFVDAFDTEESLMTFMIGLVRPSTLFLIGFLVALHYLEVKELEALLESK